MMYLKYFGLREAPFSLTPDTGYFFSYGHYREALNTLLVALRSGEGFIKVTGEVGTGKTLLCRKLLNSLGEEFYTLYVPNPKMSAEAMNLAVAEELGLNLQAEMGHHAIIKAITRRLIELASKEQKVVLCVDEAQAMSNDTLEAMRLLTNLETEKRKLLQVVLFGQPELDQRLAEPEVRQLRQRITFSYRLQPIDQEGLEAYIAHRLLVAGSHGEVQFQPRALRMMYQASRGIPRLINVLAHKSLMVAYGQGKKTLTTQHVHMACEDTEDTVPMADRTHWMVLIMGGGIGLLLLFIFLLLQDSTALGNLL